MKFVEFSDSTAVIMKMKSVIQLVIVYNFSLVFDVLLLSVTLKVFKLFFLGAQFTFPAYFFFLIYYIVFVYTSNDYLSKNLTYSV